MIEILDSEFVLLLFLLLYSNRNTLHRETEKEVLEKKKLH